MFALILIGFPVLLKPFDSLFMSHSFFFFFFADENWNVGTASFYIFCMVTSSYFLESPIMFYILHTVIGLLLAYLLNLLLSRTILFFN